MNETDSPEPYIMCKVCEAVYQNLTLHIPTHSMTVIEYKERFGVDHVRSPALREKTSSHSDYVPLSRDEMESRLNRLAEQCHLLTYSFVKWKDPSLMNQIQTVFGGWKRAMEATGIEYTAMESWSRERVTDEINVILESDGVRELAPKKVERRNLKLYKAACHHFEGWKQALVAAGVDPRDTRMILERTDEEWEDELRRWSKVHGPVSSARLDETDRTLATALRVRFGSIRKLVERLELPDGSRRKRWDSKGVSQRLRDWSEIHGPLSSQKLRDTDPGLSTAVWQVFTSMEEATDEAGIEYRPIVRQRSWTEKDVIYELKMLKAQGVRLTAKEVRGKSEALMLAAVRLFGKWNEAKRAAGVWE